MTLSREARIKLRSEMYARGEMDLQTFYDLETLDETPEDEQDMIVPEIPEAEPPKPKTVVPDPFPKKITRKKIQMTKDEFNGLSLSDQQKLYDEDPEAVKELVKGDE